MARPRGSSPFLRTLFGFALLTASLGASRAAAAGITDVTYFGFGAAGPDSIPDPDAREGLRSILSGEEWNEGIPQRLFRKTFVARGFNAEKYWRVLGTLPSPPWRRTGNETLPLSDSLFVRKGVTMINVNCFVCHSGVVAGQVVAGLGSAHLDNVSFRESTKELLAKWDNPLGRVGLGLVLGRKEMRILRDFVAYQRSIVLPVNQAIARGENYGPWVVWQHIARMTDPAQGLATYPLGQRAPLENLLKRPLPPVDPSPWWNLKYKDRDFWTRDVTLESLPTFALNFLDLDPTNDATFPARMERTRKQLAFARQTKEPPFPHRDAIDRALAARGRALFHAETPLADGSRLRCAGCHGTYGANGEMVRYPNIDLVPLATVGTDPAYATILFESFQPLYEHFRASRFLPAEAGFVRYPPRAGYMAPPLKGIWASAPYFHNGSVPTVRHVLNSKTRPTAWARSLDPFAYDEANLGLRFTTVSAEQLATLRAQARASRDPMGEAALRARNVYDTTAYGRGIGGHPFGDAMTDEERTAVIEYLKLL